MPDDGVLIKFPNAIKYEALNQIRFLTATSLFDGHDASINIMRRILQSSGVEVIHLGHNRSVNELVTAAIEEDVHAIAVSSYQGGHIEYFKFIIDSLKAKGRSNIKVFGGGGGVIIPSEIEELHNYGVTRIYSPHDGQNLGLQGIVWEMIKLSDNNLSFAKNISIRKVEEGDKANLARVLTCIEHKTLPPQDVESLKVVAKKNLQIPVLGITGTGGAGKSSLTDELIRRFRLYSYEPKIAIIAIDPLRKKTGGALLGDRIRMNSIDSENIFMRSVANREKTSEIPEEISVMIMACKAANYDLIIIETPGIGQGDTKIVENVDISLYVMTPEFGAATQLEKIDMLDFADLICVNKLDRRGGLDALKDVQKQVQRNRQDFSNPSENMPVFGAIASRFSDHGVSTLYLEIIKQFKLKNINKIKTSLSGSISRKSDTSSSIIPPTKQRYLDEIAATVREFHKKIESQVTLVREKQSLLETKIILEKENQATNNLENLIKIRNKEIDADVHEALKSWAEIVKIYSDKKDIKKNYNGEDHYRLWHKTLSGNLIPRVALPKYQDHGELLKWLLKENLPGKFPFTAGVFLFKRKNEDPTRMFAGEGDPFKTNKRFKYLTEHSEAKRLSTAFDSVTLYGFDPNERPDIYGKIGNSGVSLATIDDMKVLYDGFDLCDKRTSVSMTINGPAPTILAMFLNTAIDQNIRKFSMIEKRKPNTAELKELKSYSLRNVRGTVQADILKEDQGQNTCIFSTDFALKLMTDIQEYFVEHKIQNFYSVSISGYHMAEAGANPISELAFTLANGFTFVEAYLARGMKIDDFAPNLSFFFSNGMDPEYSVMGRVARRIWSTTMKYKYGANEKSQKLKYHIQTSGRSLHAQEIDFNDIRTTLQALIAVYDNCNSLHTNAHDEAFTTPTSDSLRRAIAIQLIINKEWGLSQNENPNQGSFIIDEMTDLVEEQVLKEFERINERGGVLGAMETGYQRAKIQEESLLYETKKHDGSIPIVGVNTFINSENNTKKFTPDLQRSTKREKDSQILRLQKFQKAHATKSQSLLDQLRSSSERNENIFSILMDAVQVCSLGQITNALFEAGGKYRRNM